MRLLVLNWQDRTNPQAGGAETHLHEIFGRLAARGHEIDVLVSGYRGAAATAELDGLHIVRAGGRYTFPLAARRAWRSSLVHRRYELVVEDLNKVPLFSPGWTGRPVVLLVHHLFGRTAFEEASLPLATATWLLERPLAACYRNVPVQAVSRSTADDLVRRGFAEDRITVIPNGVDLQVYSPDPAGGRFKMPTLLYLGRLKRYKRVDLILRAVAKLVREGVSLRAVIAGQGDQAGPLERLRDELGVADNIEMPGFVDEAEKVRLMRSSWLHVLVSPKEGWGITNMEAAACGTPTVASDSPGLRDSVVDGRTGFLVPHGDVDALAEAIRRIIADPAERDRLGRAAREFALDYTWEAAADRTETHLAGVAGHDGDRISTGREPDRT